MNTELCENLKQNPEKIIKHDIKEYKFKELIDFYLEKNSSRIT